MTDQIVNYLYYVLVEVKFKASVSLTYKISIPTIGLVHDVKNIKNKIFTCIN